MSKHTGNMRIVIDIGMFELPPVVCNYQTT